MANVTTDIPPSSYLDAQTVHLILSSEVEYVSLTTNGAQPTLSEYIAYDQLVPPNPFIAVTQDGKGRVVYDGGFPKFYNVVAPALGTPFSGLSASFKYLYNALKWVANPAKVAAGNNKILFLGDTKADAAYPVKGVGPNGFQTAMTNIASIAGFVPTFKDVDNYGGSVLNPTLADLDQYCAVVMFSTAYTLGNPDLITQAGVNDMVSFREGGNGLIFVTDHGSSVLTDLSQIKTTPAGDGFYATANRVMANFGAFFSGNFDRSPVNVGFLRSTYGDHPLYNGMLDSESISAGGSESKVVVATYPTYTQATVPPIPMTDGRYIIQLLARLNDGTVETYRFVFSIASGSVVEVRSIANQIITQINVGFANVATVKPAILGAGLGTLTGQVTVGGVKVADMVFTEAGGSVVTWLDGTPEFHVNNGDIIRAEVLSPFATHTDVPVTRFQPDLSKGSSPAAVMAMLRTFFVGSATQSPLQEAMQEIGVAYKSDYPRNINVLKDFLKR